MKTLDNINERFHGIFKPTILWSGLSIGKDQTTTGFAKMLGTYGMDLLYLQVVHDAVRKAAGTCGGITQRDLAKI